MNVSLWIWAVFSVAVVGVLLLDLLLFHRDERQVGIGEAAIWSGIWIALALAFTAVLWAWVGGVPAKQYLAGYLIERTLSIDNVFALVVIFGYFAVPPGCRHRALVWGIVGALGLRLVFILLGAVALDRFAWTAYVLAAFLVATGLRLAVRELEVRPDRNPVLRLLRRGMPMTDGYHGQHFVVRDGGGLRATPMLAVMVVIATADVAFATDSIPAVFAITREPFLVFAANAFAVLGLLALYFLLAAAIDRFRYLRPALAAVLVLVGVKMGIEDVYEVPIGTSLAAILGIFVTAVLVSVVVRRRAVPPADPAPSP